MKKAAIAVLVGVIVPVLVAGGSAVNVAKTSSWDAHTTHQAKTSSWDSHTSSWD